MIKIQAPGKLFIAGEYAVVEPRGKAIVIAVDRYIHAQIRRSEANILSFPQMGFHCIRWEYKQGQIHFQPDHPRLKLVKQTLKTFCQYAEEAGCSIPPSHFRSTSELVDETGKKYGLGSSGAITVALLTALWAFARPPLLRPWRETIFKLAAISHFSAQGNGSCADIAASVYGGWIEYTSFPQGWLSKQIQKEGFSVKRLVEKPWPSLRIRRLPPPKDLHFCVGWTGNPAKTGPMVRQIREKAHTMKGKYEWFLFESRKAVHQLKQAFFRGKAEGILQAIARNRRALSELAKAARVNIEPPKMKELINIANRYGKGKSSGAGGGDCGIAFVRDRGSVSLLQSDWEKAGIQPLSIGVSPGGVKFVKGKEKWKGGTAVEWIHP
jgi:phosphomevalonate kinase, ERG8-type, Gram-positive branch